MAGKQTRVLCDHHDQGHLASASRYPGCNRTMDRCNWLTNVYLLASSRLLFGSASTEREGVGVRRDPHALDYGSFTLINSTDGGAMYHFTDVSLDEIEAFFDKPARHHLSLIHI